MQVGSTVKDQTEGKLHHFNWSGFKVCHVSKWKFEQISTKAHNLRWDLIRGGKRIRKSLKAPLSFPQINTNTTIAFIIRMLFLNLYQKHLKHNSGYIVLRKWKWGNRQEQWLWVNETRLIKQVLCEVLTVCSHQRVTKETRWNRSLSRSLDFVSPRLEGMWRECRSHFSLPSQVQQHPENLDCGYSFVPERKPIGKRVMWQRHKEIGKH